MRLAACSARLSSATSRAKFKRRRSSISAPVESGEQIVVGVNRFTAAEEKSDADAANRSGDRARRRSQRLRALRERRDAAKARAALAEVERRAKGAENLMPAILAAVEAYATVGEISDALRRAFGEYQESVVI